MRGLYRIYHRPQVIDMPYQRVRAPLGQMRGEEIRAARGISAPVAPVVLPRVICWASFRHRNPGFAGFFSRGKLKRGRFPGINR